MSRPLQDGSLCLWTLRLHTARLAYPSAAQVKQFVFTKTQCPKRLKRVGQLNALVYAYASEVATFCSVIHVAPLSHCLALEHLTGELLFVSMVTIRASLSLNSCHVHSQNKVRKGVKFFDQVISCSLFYLLFSIGLAFPNVPIGLQSSHNSQWLMESMGRGCRASRFG